MNRRSFVLSAATTLFISLSAAADTCEAPLLAEFLKPPDDIQNGLVTSRVPISPQALLAAYKQGIFPWSTGSGGHVRWHRPPWRGLLVFDELHIGRSDMKFIKRARSSGELRVTFDKDFEQVIRLCAQVPRFTRNPFTGKKQSDGAWITPAFIEAYSALHRIGAAHSVEVWRGNQMVGGLYGVFVEGVFVGESMFHLEPDVTKLALLALIERLEAGGHKFIDTQMAIGLANKWGARLIPRSEYEWRLKFAQLRNLPF